MGDLYIHDLSRYIDNFSCTQFVETGTGVGTGLEYACQFKFKKLYSIEYVKKLYDQCKLKFDSDKRVNLLHNNSLDGLSEILDVLDEDPTFFWLDAHFPGADFHFNDYDHLKDDENLHMPLIKEIELIKSKRNNCKDVFILDDLHLYADGPFQLENPEFIKKYGKKDISKATDLFKQTHDFTIDRRHQGFFIMTPKGE